MKRLLMTVAGVALLTLGGTGAAGGPPPLPWTLRVEVVWGAERNRDAYREEIRSRLVRELLLKECFRGVVAAEPADLTLRVVLDRIVTEEQRELRSSPMGGAGEMVSLGATVTIAGTVELLAGAQRSVRERKGFRRQVRTEPIGVGEEPLPRALARAWEEPVRAAMRAACESRELLRAEAMKAGLPAAPSEPSIRAPGP